MAVGSVASNAYMGKYPVEVPTRGKHNWQDVGNNEQECKDCTATRLVLRGRVVKSKPGDGSCE